MTTPASPSKCAFCGAPLPADAKFCGACGQTVSVAAPAPAVVPPPPPAEPVITPPAPPVNAMPGIPPTSTPNATKPCPHCGQAISVDYERCPFCGGATKLEAPAPVPPATPAPVPPAPAYMPPPRPAAPAPAAPAEKKKLSTGCIVGIIIAVLLFCIGLCVAGYLVYNYMETEGYLNLLPMLARLL